MRHDDGLRRIMKRDFLLVDSHMTGMQMFKNENYHGILYKTTHCNVKLSVVNGQAVRKKVPSWSTLSERVTAR